MSKYSLEYFNKLAAAFNPDDLVVSSDERGPFNGIVSDYMLLPESLRRRGRISGAQEAAGMKSDLVMRYPLTARALYDLVGGVLGASAGGLVGSSIPNSDRLDQKNKMRAGSIIGLILGAVGGRVANTVASRSSERRALDALRKAGPMDVSKIQAGSPFAALMSGMHQKGRAEAAQLVAGNKINPSISNEQPLMTAAEFASRIPSTSVIGMPAYMTGSAVNYSKSRRDLADAKSKKKKAADGTYHEPSALDRMMASTSQAYKDSYNTKVDADLHDIYSKNLMTGSALGGAAGLGGGAVLGGIAGGLYSLLRDSSKDSPYQKKHKIKGFLKSTFGGAATGGVLGGAAGAIGGYGFGSQMNKNNDAKFKIS